MIEEIDFDNRSGESLKAELFSLTEQAIQTALEDITFKVGYQVSVSFVNAAEIQALNRNYRDVDRITDVLSFPMEDMDGRGVVLLGDVVLCVNRAQEQAKEFGHSLEREMSYLTVHSVLHLLGYDHETEEEQKEMRDEEKKIMAKLRIFKE
jgi:probable rRNA maturation factor